ncbi:hypothetical protein HBA94_05180 [Ochrobactrum sp. GRS2]|nr:hypothetical protein [Ochrobactrum sp. GRS2]
MALILGLDVATQTGFAWLDTNASLSTVRTGVIKAEGKSSDEKAASLATQLIAELHEYVDEERVGEDGRKYFTKVRRRKPLDYVAIERPLPNIMQFEKYNNDLIDGDAVTSTVNPNQMLLPTYIGAVIAIVAAYRIPFETIAPQTWHKAYYGSGFKPPKKFIKIKRHPQGGKWQNDWKTPAIERARALRIGVKTADAAEAVGIAFAASNTQTFKMLSKRAAA